MTAESTDENFERELLWCVEQLELGLETQNPNSKQAMEAMKILKVLVSSKAPMIKKRQAMRNAFGDYRKKMQEIERKSTAAAKRVKLSASGQKSHFYRKSAYRLGSKFATSGAQVDRNQNNQSLITTTSNGNADSKNTNTLNSQADVLTEDFKFNFSIENSEDSEKIDFSLVNANNALKQVSEESNVDKTIFCRSDNNFRFHFNVPN